MSSITGETVIFTATSGEGVEYWQYRYDLLNRLVEVRKNGVVVSEYGYDPEGLRVVKKARGETVHYVFEGTEPTFEKNVTTGKARSYVFALGKHIARVDGVIGDSQAKKYWYTTDHLGSIRAVTDQAGKVVYQAEQTPFGRQYANKLDLGFEEDNLGFRVMMLIRACIISTLGGMTRRRGGLLARIQWRIPITRICTHSARIIP